jgi:ankyrin repeat protein
MGAALELANVAGSRPLHGAAASGHDDVIRALAAAGCDMHAREHDGWGEGGLYGIGK